MAADAGGPTKEYFYSAIESLFNVDPIFGVSKTLQRRLMMRRRMHMIGSLDLQMNTESPEVGVLAGSVSVLKRF